MYVCMTTRHGQLCDFLQNTVFIAAFPLHEEYEQDAAGCQLESAGL